MSLQELLDEVVKEITPGEGEKEKEAEIIQRVMQLLGENPVDPIVVGSTAKDTDLAGDKDIDIFMRFPADTPRKELEENGLEIGKSVFKTLGVEFEIDYSEHPYTKGEYEGHKIELVPCYGGQGIKSSVDRTPLHTDYVRKCISETPGINDDVRLMKKFMKACAVYGAEEKVRGFSGYLVEILVIYYGGFARMLEAAGKWSMTEVIDPEGRWEDGETLKYYFTNNGFIVVDPVDKDRNVAAAVCRQSLSKFIVCSRDFLKAPSKEFFFPTHPKRARDSDQLVLAMRERQSSFYAIEFSHQRLNENLLYSQLRKTLKALIKEFERCGFPVFKSSFWSNEQDRSMLLFEFLTDKLPAIKHHIGPPVDGETRHQDSFRKKYANDRPYLKDGRWVVDTKRKHTSVKSLIKELAERKDGFGKHLRKAKTEIHSGEEVVRAAGRGWLAHLDSQV